MGSKKIVILLLITCLLFLTSSSMARAAVETHRVLSFTEDDLRVRAYAPYQAYPGDTIEIRVTAEAEEDLEEIDLTIEIFGSKPEDGKEGYGSWDDDIRFLRGDDLDKGDDKDRDYEVEIPEDADPGLVYGLVTAEWTTVDDNEDHTYAEAFTITYIMNEDYEDLQEDYEDLLSTYNILKTNYDELSNAYNSLLAAYNSLKNDYNSVKADYDTLLPEYNSVKADYDTLLPKYNSLSSDHDSLNAKYASLQANYNSLSAEYDSLLVNYNSLSADYGSLSSDYDSLVADYADLESEHETNVSELGTSRNLMYVFIVVSVALVATTIIALARKPKTKI